MRQTFVYRTDKNGNVKRIPLNQRAPYRKDETLEDFDSRMRKTLYQLECKEGSRFQVPGMSNNTLKKVWMDKAA